MRDQRTNLYPLSTAAAQRSNHPDPFKRHLIVSLVIAAVCIAVIGVIVVVSDQPARRAADNSCAVTR